MTPVKCKTIEGGEVTMGIKSSMSLEDFQQAAGLYQQYVEQMKQIDTNPKNIAFSIIPVRPSVKKRK